MTPDMTSQLDAPRVTFELVDPEDVAQLGSDVIDAIPPLPGAGDGPAYRFCGAVPGDLAAVVTRVTQLTEQHQALRLRPLRHLREPLLAVTTDTPHVTHSQDTAIVRLAGSTMHITAMGTGVVVDISCDSLLAGLLDPAALHAELLAPAGQCPATMDATARVVERLDALEDLDGCRRWLDRHARPHCALPVIWTAGPEGSAGLAIPVGYAEAELDAVAANADCTTMQLHAAAFLAVARMLGAADETAILWVRGPHLGTTAWELAPTPVVVEMSDNAATWRELVAHIREQVVLGWADRRFAPDEFDISAGGAAAVVFKAGGDYVPSAGLQVISTPGRLSVRAGEGGSEAFAHVFAQWLGTALDDLIADPTGDPRRAFLGPQERANVAGRWALGGAPCTTAASVLDLIDGAIAASPDAEAIVASTGVLSFAELDARAWAMADLLHGLGVVPGDLVGVIMKRTLDLVATLLGVWRCGAAYVPCDPTLPTERLRTMLTDARVQAVVTTHDLDEVAAAVFRGPRLWADTSHPGAPPARRVRRPAGDDLAYVIFTSGSTGRPKGVQIEHRGLANYIAWTADAYAAAPGGSPLLASISFDLGIPAMYTPLVTGQPVYLMPDDLTAANLASSLMKHAPYSFVKITPGHLAILAQELRDEQAASLADIVIAAGDAFTRELVELWLAKVAGQARLATEYGPTEITIGNSGMEISSTPATALVPLGEPIPGTTMYVLDERLEPVPIGVTGEVVVGGIGVARGYLEVTEAQEPRFVPDHLGPGHGRLYRTGDLARWLPDGSLEFLGRRDNQVKIRGHRVELGEIAGALRELDGVGDVVVDVLTGPGGNTQLVAFVVATPGTEEGVNLGARLTGRLPAYMIPTAYLAIPRVPLTRNGKVDARQLADWWRGS